MASENISFDTIPGSVRKPGKYMEFNTKLANTTLPTNRQRTLILGQMLATGSAEPLTVLDIYSDEDAAVYFGRGSLAHLMAKAAIIANNYISLQVIGVADDEAGIAATGAVTLSGTATRAGTISVYVGNERVNVAAASGDTAATLVTMLSDKLNAHTALPVSASSSGDKVVLTARNKGAACNDVIIRTASTVPGVAVTAQAMSGGENDPDISPALAAVYAAGHNIIVCPYSTQESLTKLRSHLDATGHALEKRGAVGVAGWRGSLSTATTLAKSLNCERITLGWLNDSVSLPGVVAAGYAGVIAFEEDPAMPLNTLVIKGLDIPPVTSRISRNECENALWNGVTPLEVGEGETVMISRAITTYLKNATGTDDPVMLDITTIRIADYTRKAVLDNLNLKFPRSKLSEKTPPKVRSSTMVVLLLLGKLEILENVEEHMPKLIVERDLQDNNQLNMRVPADMVNGLHVLAAVLDILG
jgi:phage tail sheath gpL-like